MSYYAQRGTIDGGRGGSQGQRRWGREDVGRGIHLLNGKRNEFGSTGAEAGGRQPRVKIRWIKYCVY